MREDQIREIIKRLIFLPFLIFIVSFSVFCIARWVPGDPALIRAGEGASPEAVEMIRHEYGLDRPVMVQYTDYVGRLLHGDLGRSIVRPDEDVLHSVLARIKVSLPIGLSAFLISLVLGTVIGLIAAVKKGKWDSILISPALFFYSIPSFILILFLILFLGLYLNVVPTGWTGGWEGIFTTKMIIPVLTLSLVSVGGIARFVRTLALDVLGQDYVLVAEASGFSFWHVTLKYILRNTLLPLITIVVPSFFSLILAGSFFVEKIYGIQGMGVFMVDVAFQRDFDVLCSLTIISAFLYVMANLVADILYTVVDPRVSFRSA